MNSSDIIRKMLGESRINAEDARANAGWSLRTKDNCRIATPREFRAECKRHKDELAKLGAELVHVEKPIEPNEYITFTFELIKAGTEASTNIYLYADSYCAETSVGRADSFEVEQAFLDYIDTLLVKPKPYDPFDL